jgi:two-component system LytT family response regulator
MYKVVIVDDEPLARQLVKTLLAPYSEMEVIGACNDGFEGFKYIQEKQPDLVFVDVQMPRLNGFEMLEMLDVSPSVIFTTAFDTYALQAFDAHAIDYLLKPITKDRFDQAIRKWLQHAGEQHRNVADLIQQHPAGTYDHRIVVKDNGRIRIIPVQDIHYIEASDDYVKIAGAGGVYLKKSTMTRIEQSIDPSLFVRVHRSFLVPVTQLLRIEPYEKDSHIAVLQCGVKIPVSRSGMAALKNRLKW